MDEQATIVVGVDGSDCARSALEFALDEATRRGAQVRVVWAFPPPEYWATAYGMPAPPPLDGAPVVAVYGWHEGTTARHRCPRGPARPSGSRPRNACSARSLPRGRRSTPVDLSGEAIPVHPARLLADGSEHASLVVVGSRGRGEFTGVLLGSVS
jgi:nucleotide-binding universal stress UspA family protein